MTTLGYLFLALIHLLLGYEIAKISREVRSRWGRDGGDLLFISLSLALFLYPVSYLDKKTTDENIGYAYRDFTDSTLYMIFHLLCWEIRIAINLVLLAGAVIIWILLAIVTIIALLIWDITTGIIQAVTNGTKTSQSA